MTKQIPSVLLPEHISPIHYSIFLRPDLDNFVFEGEETIDVEIKKSDTTITLHCAEIEVLSAFIVVPKKEIKTTRISYSKKAETVTLSFSQKLPKGKALIKLAFTGILNDKMRGFYRSRYTHNGKIYHMGVTQFESTDARRAFPCFDEPSQKATFDVSLRVPEDRTVISNTLEEEVTEHERGYKVVRFEKSPKMSSYLLAFIVGHFEFVEKISPEGVRVRVYVTPGKKHQAKFALDVSVKIMSFYHKYFGIAYPLPTLDLIAIPDFANGAMENWGAVTYRETALLFDDEHSSLHTKQMVAIIIAHELAHQWFGNLVTMKWWTHLWLNEGFASFMEYVAVDKIFPKWNIWTQFVYAEQARALSLDGLSNTHAIEIPVNHPGEISEIFDAVSYSKGASIIKMLQDYLGEKDFQVGLRLYLKTHKYGNAETKDLWKALEKTSKKPVEQIMKHWTSMPGYPMVSTSLVGKFLMLQQERFYSSFRNSGQKNKPWLIPISIIASASKSSKTILFKDVKTSLVDYSSKGWIKLNAGDSSFIRVRYSDKLLDGFKKPIETLDKRLGEKGRFALIRDIFAFVESGYSSTDEALHLLSFYKKETSYIVWAEIVVHLLELRTLLSDDPALEDFKAYARELLSKVSSHAGWTKKKNESHEETLLRSTIIYALGSMGDKKTIDMAKKIFEESQMGKKIDSDLKSTVFALMGENGGKREFEKFLEIYTNNESEEEKDRALRAMCSMKDTELLTKVLAFTFSKNVRAQDAFKSVYLLTMNPNGIRLSWDYVKENWKDIVERFAGGHLFARFISPFAKFKSFDDAKLLENFFRKNREEGIDRTVLQTLERIRSNAELLRRDADSIRAFLRNTN